MTRNCIIVLLAVPALLPSACGSRDGETGENSRADEPRSAPDLSKETRSGISRTLASYETIRAQLARDEVEAVTQTAAALEREAQDAASHYAT